MPRNLFEWVADIFRVLAVLRPARNIQAGVFMIAFPLSKGDIFLAGLGSLILLAAQVMAYEAPIASPSWLSFVLDKFIYGLSLGASRASPRFSHLFRSPVEPAGRGRAL